MEDAQWPTSEQLRKWADRSKAAQEEASKRQDAELKSKLPTGPQPCVSCGKPIEPQEHIGYENGAVVMKDYAGYGSRHDTSAVWCVICDDCVEAKCITADWLGHLHEASNELRAAGGRE